MHNENDISFHHKNKTDAANTPKKPQPTLQTRFQEQNNDETAEPNKRLKTNNRKETRETTGGERDKFCKVR